MMETTSESEDAQMAAQSCKDEDGNQIQINTLCHVDLETGKPRKHWAKVVVPERQTEVAVDAGEEEGDVDLSGVEAAAEVLSALQRFVQ